MSSIATMCYIQKNDQTLMLYRNKKTVDLHKNLYVAPGGKMEDVDNNSLKQTMLRETREETGLTPTKYQLKGFLTFSNDERVFNDLTTAKTWGNKWDVAVYIATKYSGELINSPEGVLEWVPTNKLLDLPMHAGDKLFTPWLTNKEYFIATILYKEKNVAKIEKEFFLDEKIFIDKVKATYGDYV